MPNIDFSKIDTEHNMLLNWHLDILNQREYRVKNRKSKFNNLSDVKKRLQKLANCNKIKK